VDNLTTRENREHIALKICFILFFAVAFQIIELLLLVLVLLQVVFRLITGSEKSNFSAFGEQLSCYVQQVIAYITFAKDEKPYPFSDFPQVSETSSDSK
jgi:hypothetical protein